VVEGYSFGYARHEGSILCLAADAAPTVTLCGRRMESMPVTIPDTPDPGSVCRACAQRLAGMPAEGPSRQVRCPACEQGVKVEDGRIAPHPDRSGMPCTGVNLRVGRLR
jgi:hypothetical protein